MSCCMMALLLLHWTTTTTPIVLIIGTAFELNKAGRQIIYDQLENGIFTKLNTHPAYDAYSFRTAHCISNSI